MDRMRKVTGIFAVAVLLALSAIRAPAANPAGVGSHVIEIDRPMLTVEEGLLLGNGDLSASVYQSADRVIWRFGKGDVWDRRHDLSDDPKPLHIDELAHGIAVEGWKASFHQFIQPLHGTDHPKRVKEISKDLPSYARRPYPCPKPLGELSLQLPMDSDLTNCRISQRLLIEEGRLEITCTWPGARQLTLESFVTPHRNSLVVRWQARKCPVWFSLYRWADPPFDEYGARVMADTRNRVFKELYGDPKVTPLPRPETLKFEGLDAIQQQFAADPIFPKGFRYWLVPFAAASRIEAPDVRPLKEARLQIIPQTGATEGWLAIAVPTSSDPGDVEGECRRIRADMANDPAAAMVQWRDHAVAEAHKFWSKSSITIADPLMEGLWYETFHIRRCTYRQDAVPPGLYLPSAVGDYSVWHGDYHTNFNLQAAFMGNYEANHFEVGDAYFRAMDFLLEIGRKIAHDYYNARGAFIQLTGFPIRAQDDPFGVGPLCRMAYMTGWTVQPYWSRYVYSGDKKWLRDKGYPAIRDCALFYTDFLKKGKDGLYAAFPSAEEEPPFTGDPNTYTNRPFVLQHARYCLRAAIRASGELGLDEALRAEWQDRLDHMAPDNGPYFGNQYDSSLRGLDKWCEDCSPPQWGRGKPYRRQSPGLAHTPASLAGRFTAWWLSHPGGPMTALRDGSFVPDRDYYLMREHVKNTRHANGLVYQKGGLVLKEGFVFNEELAIVAPLQEMMLQSWDGALRIFPAWPKKVDASYQDFRAEGAFLITAAWSQGQVTALSLRSEKGLPCAVYSPWPSGIRVTDNTGKEIDVAPDRYDRPSFATQPGAEYRLRPR